MCVAIIACVHCENTFFPKSKLVDNSTSVNKTQAELEDMFGDAPADGYNQVYAEIGDQDTTSPSTTQPQPRGMAAPSAAGSGSGATVHTSPQYEDVSNVARPGGGGGDYQITVCAAYAVAH